MRFGLTRPYSGRSPSFPGTATIAPSEPRGEGPNVLKDAPEGHLPADSVRCASTRRDGGWSAIAGQEALVPAGVVLRPFGAAIGRATLGG